MKIHWKIKFLFISNLQHTFNDENLKRQKNRTCHSSYEQHKITRFDFATNYNVINK